MDTDNADDEMVMGKVNKLEEYISVECDALKELCEMDGESNLGGLPLALVLAGAYIRKYECSFEEYKTQF